jgi:transposase
MRAKASAPYHPAMLLALLFYGYATGVFSSRKLEKATYDSMAFKYICANQNPDHDTINSFRKRFRKEIESLFVEILVLAEALGLLKLGTVSLDGTKIKANASKHKALSWDYANQLEAQFKQ